MTWGFEGSNGANVIQIEARPPFPDQDNCKFNAEAFLNCPNSATTFSADPGQHDFVVTLDWSAKVYDLFQDGVFETTLPFCNSSATDIGGIFFVGHIEGSVVPKTTHLDEIIVRVGGVPEPPPGLTGEVTRAGSTSTTGKVELSWLLSSDDPNRDTGDFEYHVYLDGSRVGTDTVDSDDGGGVRTFDHLFTGSASFGESNFTVTAQDIGESDPSCTITIDLDTVGDSDSCGDRVPDPSAAPKEFQDSVLDLMQKRGFITAESQILFVLIVTGLITVLLAAATRMMKSGLLKNTIIMTPGSVLIIVSAFFLEVPGWMVVVSLILGILMLMGGPIEARNTYYELRDAARETTVDLSTVLRNINVNPFNRRRDRDELARISDDVARAAEDIRGESPDEGSGDE